VSWQLVAILFVIVAFEGVKQLRPDELVLRCNPLGAWRIVAPTHLWRDWHLVSLLPPFFLTIVVPPGVGASPLLDGASDIAPFAGASQTVLALRVRGAIEFIVLILGVPWGVSRFGATGLIAFLGLAFVLSVSTAIMSAILLVDEGLPRRISVRRAVSLASPFGTPLAAEVVLSARIRRYPRLTAISQLIGETQFHAWIRRWAYDLQSNTGSINDAWLGEIASSLSSGERAGILDSASEGCSEAERYCPRCGEKYLLESSFCTECEGIQLRMRGQKLG
jgi:YD repeat-containing protein